MDALLNLVEKGNEFLMSYFLVAVLFGTGIYYTIRLRFIQVRRFKEGFKLVFGNFNMNGEKHEKGEMTPFQSVATAIAAQVGTGNLAGAATALIGGGPGAIFWMWLSAFFGMATIYAEAVLAQQYKTEVDGEVTGGPVYYIKAAFKGAFGRGLAVLFAVFIILALGFTGWVGMSRIARAEMLKLKESEYVLASKTLGAKAYFIIFREIFPNMIGPVITNTMFSIPNAIFMEAYLSFIGLGIPVPLASLGSLISDAYKQFTTHPYQIVWPVVVLSVLMLCFNILADGLREALDPKMKEM